MATAGYSGTPLVKKLKIKEGFAIMTVNAPTLFQFAGGYAGGEKGKRQK
jgi:uncharacterized protein YvpB